MTLTAEKLVGIAMTNPINVQLTSRLPALGLDQCMLTAGCLFQAVWNQKAQRDPGWGIKDYDVFYFDPDLSWEAENEVIHRAQRLLQDLGVNVEFKNQARVHLWYSQRFGGTYPGLNRPGTGLIATWWRVLVSAWMLSPARSMPPMAWRTWTMVCCASIRQTPGLTCLSRRRRVIRFAGLG